MAHSERFANIRQTLETKYFVYCDLENNVIKSDDGKIFYMAQFVKYRNGKIYEYDFGHHCFVYEEMYADPARHFPWQYYNECTKEEIDNLIAPIEAKMLLSEETR